MSNIGSRVTRRNLVKWLGLGTATAFLSGCGTTAAPTTAPAPPASAPGATPTKVSPPATKPKEVTLHIASDWNSGKKLEFTNIADKTFEEQNPGVKVVHWHMGGGGTSGPGGYTDIIVAQLLTDTSAEVFNGWGNILFDMEPYLADVTDETAKQGFKLDDYYYVQKTSFDDKGRLRGIPFNNIIAGWICNKTMLDKKGIKPNTDGNWTWDDFLMAAKELTNPKEKEYGYWIQALTHIKTYVGFMEPTGVHVLDEQNWKTNLDKPEAIEGWQFLIDLMHKHKVAPTPGETTALAGGMSDPFIAGKIGFYQQNLNNIKGFLPEVGNRFEFQPLPTPKHPKTGLIANNVADDPWFISKKAFNDGLGELAVKYALMTINDPKVTKAYVDTGGSMPAKKTIANGADYMAPPPNNMQQLVKNRDDTKSCVWRYYFTGWAEWDAAIKNELSKSGTGEVPADKAMLAACKKADDVLAKLVKDGKLVKK